MTFQLYNEVGIEFPPLKPAYEEGELFFARFRALIPRDAKDSILGEGGTGLIHLVRDELMDRIVALKLPHESVLRDPSARYDVIRETRQAIELTHPHIVRIHDFHEGTGNWGISMQYVRGKNLHEWRLEGRTGSRRAIVPYAVERIENWITQLCNALIYAHEDAHMVHRDIKPKNLMLERRDDGQEKLLLTDFGITQKLRLHTMMLSRVQPESTEAGAMGTLPYMSWEQIQGAPASTLDDIYSVGATIYELLTGRPPFYEGAYEEIRTQVENTVPPSMIDRLRQFDLAYHEIPDEWEETVAACLAKRPEDRPQTMREVMARLGLSGNPAPAPARAVSPVSSEEVDSLREEIRTLREEREGSDHEITTLRARHEESLEKAASLEKELGELRLALGNAEGAEGERLQSLANLQAELQESLAKTAALEQEIAEARLALGNAEGLGGERSRELENLQGELQEKSGRIEEISRQLEETRRQLEEAAARCDELQSAHSTLEQQLQSAEETRGGLEAELARAVEEANAAAERAASIEQSAEERIRQIEADTGGQLEEARQAALRATEVAEKAARRKTGRALAEALASAELARQQAAKLTEELRRNAASPAPVEEPV